MRVSTLLLAACAVFAPLAGFARTVRPVHSSADMIDSSNIESTFAAMHSHAEWAHFKAVHQKKYATKELEAHRFSLFTENMRIAAELHKKNPEATFGMNKVRLSPRVLADFSGL